MGLYCLVLWGFADSMDDYNPSPRKIHEPTIFLWHGTRGIWIQTGLLAMGELQCGFFPL